MKQAITILLLVFLGTVFYRLIPLTQPGELGSVAKHYATEGVKENRGANLVTSVIVNYRGLDTLGEVVVLFLSVTGASFVLRRRRGLKLQRPVPASELLETGARVLFGPLLVFGAYIFIHGHLTPGGGFQGGAVVASAVLLLLLADRGRPLPHALMAWIESLSGFAFALVGLLGLVVTGSFLANRGVVGLGVWNSLFSAGLIPIIYTLIGLKVGSELAALLDLMIHSVEGEGGEA